MKTPQTDAFRALDVTSELSLRERILLWIKRCQSLETQLIDAQANLAQIRELHKPLEVTPPPK